MVRVDSGDVVETLPVRRAVQRFSRCICRGVVLFPFADNHVSTDEFQTMLYSLVWLGYAFFPYACALYLCILLFHGWTSSVVTVLSTVDTRIANVNQSAG